MTKRFAGERLGITWSLFKHCNGGGRSGKGGQKKRERELNMARNGHPPSTIKILYVLGFLQRGAAEAAAVT